MSGSEETPACCYGVRGWEEVRRAEEEDAFGREEMMAREGRASWSLGADCVGDDTSIRMAIDHPLSNTSHKAVRISLFCILAIVTHSALSLVL